MGYVQFQPIEKLNFGLSIAYVDFFRESDKQKIYDYAIIRSRNTFQVNKYSGRFHGEMIPTTPRGRRSV